MPLDLDEKHWTGRFDGFLRGEGGGFFIPVSNIVVCMVVMMAGAGFVFAAVLTEDTNFAWCALACGFLGGSVLSMQPDRGVRDDLQRAKERIVGENYLLKAEVSRLRLIENKVKEASQVAEVSSPAPEPQNAVEAPKKKKRRVNAS